VTDYWLHDQGLIPRRGVEIFLFIPRPEWLWVSPSLSPMVLKESQFKAEH